MAINQLKGLPLGTSDFIALRMADEIYVDKTEMVFSLAVNRGKYFLARPRRFGKSLLISTFESLFKYGLRDFKGLAIENLWKEEATYNVVRLDFSEIKDFADAESFSERLISLISRKFAPFGFRYELRPFQTVSDQLSDWLTAQEKNSLVLLIDEYDAPLTSCLNNKTIFKEVRRALSAFYSVLKSNEGALRFAFITGITKFNKTSIFSELNNLSDLSLNVEYGTLLGYTYSETQKYFSGYLDNPASLLGISRGELTEELIKHYDGFCFERTAKEHVFAPWSMLNFLSSPRNGFVDYWFESGGKPSVLVEYLKSHALRHPEEYGREKSISLSTLSGSSDLENLSDLGLLTQAGYLTIKAVRYGDTVFLDYPNLEVKRAMAQLYMERLLDGKVAGQVGAGPIAKVLGEESAESVFHILNRLFLAIDYQNYPVKDEASLRAYVQVYFSGAGLEPKVEQHNAHGRSDLEVSVGERHWVFEFKVSYDGEKEEEILLDGISQMKARHYGEQGSSKELKRVVLVYSIPSRQFVKWKLLTA